MENQKADFGIIRMYLLYWDPLGILEDTISAGEIPNDYDHYAREIHKLLENNASSSDLRTLFERIQTVDMGIGIVDDEKDALVAQGLVGCYKEHRERFY